MEKVKIILCISGDYCAFHEMSFKVEFDITNNIQLGYNTLKELEEKVKNGHSGYSDYNIIDGIKDGDKYYYSI